MDVAAIRVALADALAFVLPIECAGCGEPDVSLCERCALALTPAPSVRDLDGMRVASGLVFDGAVARVVRTLKEEGRTSVARSLAPALAAAASGFTDAETVPVPTSPAAMRRRGYRVAELLARRAGLSPVRALRVVRRTADQRALGRDDRAENVSFSMRARGVEGCRILLVDDVVTTGATLREAFRALVEGGAEVVGAATVATTPRRGMHAFAPYPSRT